MANSSESPKLSQLRALVAVKDQGNFSAAALHLDLAQSTVSHAIATLEEDLGVVLVVRSRQGAVLTPTGEQIYGQATQVLQQLAAIRETAQRARELQTGQVRIATVRSIATHVLPDAIAQFRAKHPTLTVDITECDRYAEVEESLRDGQADLGLTILPSSPEFEAWELFRDEFVALLPPHHGSHSPAQNNRSLTWAELTQYPMMVNVRSPQHNQFVTDHLARFGHTLQVDYQVREDSTLISMVEKGLGATIIAKLAAEPIPPSICVKSLPVHLERVVGVAFMEKVLLPRAAIAFLDVLRLSKLADANKTL